MVTKSGWAAKAEFWPRGWLASQSLAALAGLAWGLHGMRSGHGWYARMAVDPLAGAVLGFRLAIAPTEN